MIHDVALAGRLVLGPVLILSGAAKLAGAGRRSFATAVRGFGVGERLAPAVVAAVPVLELVLGSLLVVGLATRAVAVASLALLAGFSVAVGRLLARGQKVGCGCFGTASERPVGPGTLLRNGALMAAAVVAAFEPSWSAPFGTVGHALPVVLVAGGLLAIGAVVSQVARLRV